MLMPHHVIFFLAALGFKQQGLTIAKQVLLPLDPLRQQLLEFFKDHNLVGFSFRIFRSMFPVL
jgi:hypothetical protein